MSFQTLYRWGGGALLVGGLLSLVSSTLNAFLYPGTSPAALQLVSAPWVLLEALLLVGLVATTIGLPACYLREAPRAGRLGFAGFLLLWLGLLLALGFSVVRVTLWPYLAQSAPGALPSGDVGPVAGFLLWILLPWLLLSTGSILLGVGTTRAGVFPRAAGILLLIAGILSVVTFVLPPSPIGDIVEPIGDAALFLAIAWMGYSLVAQPKERTARSSAAPSTAQPG